MGEATLHASLLFETDMINYLSVFNQDEKKEKDKLYVVQLQDRILRNGEEALRENWG